MSSKIVSGDGARSAQAIKWSARAPLYADPSHQPTVQRATASADRPFASEGTLDAQITEARRLGRAEGEQAARAQISSQIDAINLRVARAVEELSAFKATLRREAEQDIVKLAVAIARKVLQREIAVDPEALVGLVKVALDKIDLRELHNVRVHPDQVEGVQRALQSIGTPRRIEVQGDATLECGAAVFETSRGALDVSVETQLRQIERGFADMVARR